MRFFPIYNHIFFSPSKLVRVQLTPPGWLLDPPQIKGIGDLDLPNDGPVTPVAEAGDIVGDTGVFRLAPIPKLCQYCNLQQPKLVLVQRDCNFVPTSGTFICKECVSHLSSADQSKCSQYLTEISSITCQEDQPDKTADKEPGCLDRQ